MSKTIREIVTDAQELLGDVPGAGVQTYSDDRMFRDCIRAFDIFHKKYPWEQYTSYTLATLDGVTGKITTDEFQFLKSSEDIFAIFPENSDFELPTFGVRRNPAMLRGSGPARFWSTLPTIDPDFQWKRIQIIPPTATGNIVIVWRHYPRNFSTMGQQEPWKWEDVMDLDDQMLVHATAWMTLSHDDINSNATQDQQNLADDRFNEITVNLARRKMTPNAQGGGVPYNWYPTRPY